MNKILVMGPAWVGDMILAHSLFKQLKQQHPACHISVAAPAWTLPLIERMPEVSQAIALPFKHGEAALWSRYSLGKQLSQQAFDQAILLTNSFKSAIVPWAAGIPQRTGYTGECRYGLVNDRRTLDKRALKKTVERFVALGLATGHALPATLPRPHLTVDTAQAQALAARWQLAPTQTPILGLCPGAEYGEAKRWPAAYYAEVAQSALDAGWQVCLFGSVKDQAVTQTIQALTQQRCIDLAGYTTLSEAIDLMALCDRIVSNDSGLMHMAAALDKPLVAIYGSSDPEHTPPMHPQAVIEYLGLACSPCFERSCPRQHLNCLREIKPANIIAKLST